MCGLVGYVGGPVEGTAVGVVVTLHLLAAVAESANSAGDQSLTCVWGGGGGGGGGGAEVTLNSRYHCILILFLLTQGLTMK